MGMIWVRGESRTGTDSKEWDIQPPKSGEFPQWLKAAGYVGRGHINVSFAGKVTH
jgi:hypothetical protein